MIALYEACLRPRLILERRSCDSFWILAIFSIFFLSSLSTIFWHSGSGQTVCVTVTFAPLTSSCQVLATILVFPQQIQGEPSDIISNFQPYFTINRAKCPTKDESFAEGFIGDPFSNLTVSCCYKTCNGTDIAFWSHMMCT